MKRLWIVWNFTRSYKPYEEKVIWHSSRNLKRQNYKLKFARLIDVGEIYLSSNRTMRLKTKHIDLRYHFLKVQLVFSILQFSISIFLYIAGARGCTSLSSTLLRSSTFVCVRFVGNNDAWKKAKIIYFDQNKRC